MNKEPTRKIQTVMVRNDGTITTQSEEIVCEHFLDVYVNEQLVARLVCTPEYLEELVIGRLLTERIIERIEDIEKIYICEEKRKAKVFLKKQIQVNLEPMLKAEPTCCTGNQIYLRNTAISESGTLSKTQWKKEWIFALAGDFARGTLLHKKTKGTHSCYLSVAGETVFAVEDIGRHNALDKVIGYAALHHIAFEECIVFTSGRVPTDMVMKVIAVGSPVLASKAVPTDAAIELAQLRGLTLICRAWEDSFEIYTGDC